MHVLKGCKRRASGRSAAAQLVPKLRPINPRGRLVVNKKKRGVAFKVDDRPFGRKRKANKGNRFKTVFEPTDYLRAAFGTPANDTIASHMLGMSRRHIGRLRCVVASLLLYMQLITVGLLLMMSKDEAPLCVITREAWDETQQRCAFQLSPEFPESQQSSAWQTMVYRCLLIVVWQGRPPVMIELLMPPVVILSTAAASMFYALTGHPQYYRLQTALRALRGAAKFSFQFYETDAASGNAKLIAFFLSNACPRQT